MAFAIWQMATTIDSFGRLVIPKTARDAVGLRPGTPVKIEVREDGILVSAIAKKPAMREYLEGVEEFRKRHRVRLSRKEILELCDKALEIEL